MRFQVRPSRPEVSSVYHQKDFPAGRGRLSALPEAVAPATQGASSKVGSSQRAGEVRRERGRSAQLYSTLSLAEPNLTLASVALGKVCSPGDASPQFFPNHQGFPAGTIEAERFQRTDATRSSLSLQSDICSQGRRRWQIGLHPIPIEAFDRCSQGHVNGFSFRCKRASIWASDDPV